MPHLPESIDELDLYFMHRARYLAKRALASGRIVREPCRCGRDDAQMHHSDYSDPLAVEWVCRSCLTARQRAGLLRQRWMDSADHVEKLIARYAKLSKRKTKMRERVLHLLREHRALVRFRQGASKLSPDNPPTPVEIGTVAGDGSYARENAQVTENRCAITTAAAIKNDLYRGSHLSDPERAMLDDLRRLSDEDRRGSATWGRRRR